MIEVGIMGHVLKVKKKKKRERQKKEKEKEIGKLPITQFEGKERVKRVAHT